jgi:phosphohistidine swiveling domain-containing protein
MMPKVAFTMEDGFLADFTRSLVLEKKWRDALRILRDATHPALALDECVAILTGESTLAREEQGYRVAPQDQNCEALARYRATAAWQQAGILDVDGEFYQPYAKIVSFGVADEDAVLADSRQRDGDYFSMEQYRQRRAMYYARSESDIVRFDVSPEPVLFQRVQGPAFWVKTFTEPADAVDNFRLCRSLEALGHGSRSATPEELLPNNWEFYFRAAIEGFLFESDEIDLARNGHEHLEKLLQMKTELDTTTYQVDSGEIDFFDEDGYDRKARLSSDFERNALALFYRVRILEKAKVQGGFMTLRVGEGEQAYDLQVPRAPFLFWASRGVLRVPIAPQDMQPWRPVSPLGMKMMSDDPMHTDWWIGAGLNPRDAYETDNPVNAAAWKYCSELAFSEGRQCIRLAGKGKVTGGIVFPKAGEAVPEGTIAVVPSAGVDYELALISACRKGSGAVIAAVGGKLAHLATVSRELDGRLVVVDEALTRFSEGDVVTLDLDAGTVMLHGKHSE